MIGDLMTILFVVRRNFTDHLPVFVWSICLSKSNKMSHLTLLSNTQDLMQNIKMENVDQWNQKTTEWAQN